LGLLQLEDRVVPSTAALLKDIGGTLASPAPQHLTAVGSTLFFTASGGTGTQLGKYDGSTFTGVTVGTAANPDPRNLTAVGSTLFFTANDGTGSQLWQYDGSGLGEVTVGTAPSPNPDWLTAVGSTLYFTASDEMGNQQLWQYDGSGLTEVTAGTAAANPYNLTAVGSTLFFTADDGTGYQLWQYDGSGLTEVTAGTAAANPYNLTVVGGTLYFTADDGTGYQLWQYDGNGLREVPINPDGASNPTNLAAVGTTLYLSANDDSHGSEPWVVTNNPDQATPTVTVSAAGGSYNGSPFAATATVNGGPRLEGVAPTLTYYAGSRAAGTPLAGPPVDAGTYTVVAAFAGSPDYTSATSAPVTFTIARATPAVAAWINPLGGSWDVASNWSTGAVPGPGDDAVLHLAGDVTVYLAEGTASVHSLQVYNALVLDGGSVSSAGAVQVFGSLTVEAGSLSSAGGLQVAGGALDFDGGSLSGAVVLTDAALHLGGGGAATFLVRGHSTPSGAVAAGQAVWVQDSSAGGGAILTTRGDVTNAGTLDLDSTWRRSTPGWSSATASPTRPAASLRPSAARAGRTGSRRSRAT